MCTNTTNFEECAPQNEIDDWIRTISIIPFTFDKKPNFKEVQDPLKRFTE